MVRVSLDNFSLWGNLYEMFGVLFLALLCIWHTGGAHVSRTTLCPYLGTQVTHWYYRPHRVGLIISRSLVDLEPPGSKCWLFFLAFLGFCLEVFVAEQLEGQFHQSEVRW